MHRYGIRTFLSISHSTIGYRTCFVDGWNTLKVNSFTLAGKFYLDLNNLMISDVVYNFNYQQNNKHRQAAIRMGANNICIIIYVSIIL